MYDNKIFIYLVSLSEMNYTLFENLDVNRFDDAMETFQNLYNQRLKAVDIHLLFTKIDIFQEKYQEMALEKYFKDSQIKSWNEAYDLIVKKFQSLVNKDIKTIQYANVLDQENCVQVLSNILKLYS